MSSAVNTNEVNLPDREYTVRVGPGMLSVAGVEIAPLFPKGRAAIITDSNVGPLYLGTLQKSLTNRGISSESFEVEAGEASKSMNVVTDLCSRMIRAGFNRQSFVIALGGGVVGDLAGFVAGVFYRGIPFVQVPTSVVALVDSSVGGKTGVNAPEGKNLIGVFHQPRLVLADVETLSTLPQRELCEGFAEVIKHAAIRDAEMIPMIENFEVADTASATELIARNVAIKATIVEEDERETSGTRALLNFGHTVGHAVEAAGGYGRFLHGEAISIGLAAALLLSVEKAGLSQTESDRVLALLHQFDLPTSVPSDLPTSDLLAYLEKDKKFVDGAIRFVLVRSLGDAFVSSEVSREDIAATIDRLRS